MSDLYPSSVKELAGWSKGRGLPIAAARKRYAQYVVMAAISAHDIGSRITFKGGNALRLVYGNPRGTLDLDFTAEKSVPDSDEWIRKELTEAAEASRQHKSDYKLRVQSVRRMPKSPEASFPTYQVTIGYALAGDRRYENFDTDTRTLADTVILEISLNDLVCYNHTKKIDEKVEVLVCTLDDIIAEKLRSLLQQPIRKRFRKQDVFDIARILTDHREELSLDLIAECLQDKCAARDIQPSKAAFNNDVRDHAQVEYEELRGDTDGAFIPFGEAWELVKDLVADLDIPAD